MHETESPTVGCPTCGGPLSALDLEWVCEVGHRFSLSKLADDQAEAVVRTLWYALRALEDRAISSKFAAARYDDAGLDRQSGRMRTQHADDLAMVERLHELLQGVDGTDRRDSETVSHDEPTDQGSHA